MKLKKFLPLLLVAPLLVCAKPALPPYAWPHDYFDFEVSDFTVGASLGDNTYEYSLNLKNTGEEYIVLDYFGFASSGDTYSYSTFYLNECLKPNASVAINGEMHGNEYDADETRYYVQAVFPSLAATYSSVSLYTTYTYEYDNGNVYEYTFYAEDLSDNPEYYVSYLVHANVKGVEKYYFCTYQYFDIRTTEEVDPDAEIEILGVDLVYGRNKRQEQINNLWTAIWIILAVILGAPIPVAVLTFYIPIIIVCIAPWKKKEDKESPKKTDED